MRLRSFKFDRFTALRMMRRMKPPIHGITVMLSPRRKAALIAGAVFLVLGGVSIHASPMSANVLEDRLQGAAEEALYALRADEWARVEMNGQTATLSGLAPSRQARQAALQAVSTASWAGGVVAGGVTKVIDQTRLPGEAESFALRLDLTGGRMRLSGLVPDAETGARLEDAARDVSSGRVDAEFRLAPGAAPAGWEQMVVETIRALGALDTGAGLVTRDRAALTGLAPSTAAARDVRRLYETAPDGFSAAALVRADGEGFQTRLSDPRLCELLIRGALGPRPIAFAPGRSILTGESRAALRRAGEVYAACVQAGDLIIAVRADEPGDDGAALALMRGEAAATAMAEAGVERARFLAQAAPLGAPEAIQFTLTPLSIPDMATTNTEEEQG